MTRRLNAWVVKKLGGVIPSTLPASPQCPNWTVADRDDWKRILCSDIGQKVLARARAAHLEMLKAASNNFLQPGLDVHAGRGFEHCLIWLQSLSCTVHDKTENASVGQGDGLNAEPRTEEQEFLARISP